MIDNFAIGVLIPLVALCILGWVVPQLLARVIPEGVAALFVLGVLAFMIVLAAAIVTFVVIYALRGTPVSEIGFLPGVVIFGRAGLLSGLVWLPVLIISVANLPRHWKTEVW